MTEEEYEVEDEAKTEVHECKTCGVGQYFQAVKMAGGDWQGIVYEKCLPCRHNQMAHTLGGLLKLIGREVPDLDNWVPKKPVQGLDVKAALAHGLLMGKKAE